MSPAHCLRGALVSAWAFAAFAPANSLPNVTADNCSVAAGRDITNTQIMNDCSTRITIILGVQEIIQEREIDRRLLELIATGNYDDALERIEVLTRQPSTNSSTYLSIAATMLATQGAPDEALQYARRAFDADRNDGFVAARYFAMLVINGRNDEARNIINEVHRRRQQFSGIGAHWIELAWIETNYSPQVLSVWFQTAASCGRHSVISEAGSTGRRTGTAAPAGAPCSLDEETNRNVRALRERVVQLVGEAASTEPNSRISLQLQYHGMHYVMLCDLLLGDNDAAARAEEAMDTLIARMDRQFGPWALLTSFAAAFHLDALTPATYLESKYALFDRALRAAPTATIGALASFASEDQLVRRFSGLMLAGYRLAWARAAVRLRKHDEAWTGLIRAIQETRPYGNSAMAINVRLGSLSLMTTLLSTSFSPDTRILRDEYLMLRRSFSQDPRLWTSLSSQFLLLGDALCDMNIVSGDECQPDMPTLDLEED